ncbi:hypothetical protein KDA_47090 [Dictyobacter alpinus]|uniref:Uncharacterized protein n=1 Tax=Dictyobacter alpinus TaxID=2014873 RepID=A0A402BCY8_9CHLR|nr:hypothetical protein [Dictyobacter alpinus]GCE29225.1 hypothetical protein KDA_47090 [Dictyobacter alpinus]
MSVAVAVEKACIARQTVHEWMTDGTVRWIYDADQDMIWLDRDEVARLRQRRFHPKTPLPPRKEISCSAYLSCPHWCPNVSETA